MHTIGELLSIVLPIDNQADHIGDLVKEYEAAPSHIPHETILIVNGAERHRSKSAVRLRCSMKPYGQPIASKRVGGAGSKGPPINKECSFHPQKSQVNDEQPPVNNSLY
ncbi:MAG: hypothetical protein OXN17_05900 [Candidatus Poribacteria bacterium]|nr:hypothetical protein [Candidatus Poribacteria bacterium]